MVKKARRETKQNFRVQRMVKLIELRGGGGTESRIKQSEVAWLIVSQLARKSELGFEGGMRYHRSDSRLEWSGS